MITFTPEIQLQQILDVVTTLTYVVTAASAICNLPFMSKFEKAEGKLAKISSFLNVLALNLRKLSK